MQIGKQHIFFSGLQGSRIPIAFPDAPWTPREDFSRVSQVEKALLGCWTPEKPHSTDWMQKKTRKKMKSKYSESRRLSRHELEPGPQGGGGVRLSSLASAGGGKSSKDPKPMSLWNWNYHRNSYIFTLLSNFARWQCNHLDRRHIKMMTNGRWRHIKTLATFSQSAKVEPVDGAVLPIVRLTL